ncbi:hypothetical protein B0H10DRAFT_2195033 [Mycena sp. CBHHK59/15]|nr:hypothetical protein B0H10DRAFT_2195033 [Mycena sp. CBHHK59/15]
MPWSVCNADTPAGELAPEATRQCVTLHLVSWADPRVALATELAWCAGLWAEAGGVNGLGGIIAANIEGGGFQKDLGRRDSAGSRGETSSVDIPATLWQNGRTREQDDVARRTTLWQNEPEGTALWARNTTTITQISEQHTRGRRLIVSNGRLRVEAPTEKPMAPTNRLRAVGGDGCRTKVARLHRSTSPCCPAHAKREDDAELRCRRSLRAMRHGISVPTLPRPPSRIAEPRAIIAPEPGIIHDAPKIAVGAESSEVRVGRNGREDLLGKPIRGRAGRGGAGGSEFEPVGFQVDDSTKPQKFYSIVLEAGGLHARDPRKASEGTCVAHCTRRCATAARFTVVFSRNSEKAPGPAARHGRCRECQPAVDLARRDSELSPASARAKTTHSNHSPPDRVHPSLDS